uniref:Uncharacterized protein n=1 Tax=Chromera velia CCMP2878 TaxID=1169474 RepID=A0A0G4I4R0_9ALVE|eukprot:Cvel_10987.t1-p1 / transcript=Cvel_10987.t1 / gene=Cvel_10987 / organism=Chromera_velia_CCMP2878 / gene_product=Putative ankyrin repeat protein RF_0381, putative / transcript_product=Putative ankyrin repeat protein RF_0381, putative / location=Cvel_scaffold676:46629-48065(-) / protein_length=479 / sequence_SO=supercontig / SO=protein_coding / is_pseudo=false
MLRTAANLVPVREGLRSLAESLQEVVRMVQSMDALLGTVEFPEDVPLANPPQDDASSALLPPDAVALDRATKLVDQMRKGVRVELNTFMSRYYRMDLEPLFALDTGNVIRSFQAVEAKTLNDAVDDFMIWGGKQERDDLELLLKVGAEMDTAVDVSTNDLDEGDAEGGDEGENSYQETALMNAVGFGSLEAVKILVGAGVGFEVVVDGGRALHIAVKENMQEIARFLVNSGAEVDAVTNTGVTPLFIAAQHGLTDLVRFFLGRGADVNVKETTYGKSPIFDAIGRDHPDVVELLLDHGASVNQRDQSDQTPLFFTASIFDGVPLDRRDIAERLISRGADVHARGDRGRTVLQTAAKNGAVGVVEVLLENGADVHATDDMGDTALHYVAASARERTSEDSEETERGLFEKKLSIAELLLSRGIGVGALDEEGWTALDVAEAEQPDDSPVLALLRGLAPAQEGHQKGAQEDWEEIEFEVEF